MKLINSKAISLSEVASMLEDRKKENPSGELEYEQANTLAYCSGFAGIPFDKQEHFIKDVSKVVELPEVVLVTLMDILPKKEDELKQIVVEEKASITDEQAKELVKVFKKYRGS